jgi:hypothetical protein
MESTGGESMTMSRLATAAVVLALLAIGTAALATNYVSSNGRFYFTYPDDWEQVSYSTVDFYLATSRADTSALRYEAVFAPADAEPFHSGQYLIITLDTLGALDGVQIDSLIADLSEGSVWPTDEPTADFLRSGREDVPNYDQERQIITMMSDLGDAGGITRRNLWAIKLYERGLANFFFYAPDSLFEASLTLFGSMVFSFSTENLAEAAPRESLRLAEDVGKPDNRTLIIVLVAAIVLLAVAVLLIRIRRNKN